MGFQFTSVTFYSAQPLLRTWTTIVELLKPNTLLSPKLNMESICHFSPLWQRPELLAGPQKAIGEVRLNSLRIFLNKYRSEVVKSLNLDGMFPYL